MFFVLLSGESSWGGGFSWCCCWLHGDMHHYFVVWLYVDIHP